MKSPVTLMFFNRPDTLQRVFSEVKKAKPPILYLVQDGPRLGSPDDKEKVLKCREIVEDIDWPCEVHKNYSETNLGCGMRPQSGITWALSQSESTIILEDDCVPDQSFFVYCDELLEKYKHDTRVCYISGLNHFVEWDSKYDYFFTKTGSINGWATWRRAWEKYDYYVHAINDKELISSLSKEFTTKAAYKTRIEGWEKANLSKKTQEKMSYWDIQWGFVKYSQNSLVIVPRVNLITNIGTSGDATHTQMSGNKFVKGKTFVNIPSGSLTFPLKHPDYVIRNYAYDEMLEKNMYKTNVIVKIKSIIKKLVKR